VPRRKIIFTCENSPSEGSEQILGGEKIGAADAIDDEVHALGLELPQLRLVVLRAEHLLHAVLLHRRVLLLARRRAVDFHVRHCVRQLGGGPANPTLGKYRNFI
jgi:hypothetical protein